MAKYRRGQKIQPAPMTLNFPIGPIVGTYDYKTIDLSQCASIINRRFYRQGLNWAVAGFTLHTTPGITGSLDIAKLPESWVVSGAWEKTMRHWLAQQDREVEKAGAQSQVARYRDFKIHMDKTHVDDGFGSNFTPYVFNYNAGTENWAALQTGEWNASLVVIPNEGGAPGNTQEFTLHMVGDDDGAPSQSKAMIKAYSLSRSVPFSPDPEDPTGGDQGLYVQMADVGEISQEIIDNATDRNDNLPYDQFDYPGGDTNGNGLSWHDRLTLSTTTVSGKTTCGGGSFPCGLIRLKIPQTMGGTEELGIITYTTVLQVHLVPGGHRGYMAESMVEM